MKGSTKDQTAPEGARLLFRALRPTTEIARVLASGFYSFFCCRHHEVRLAEGLIVRVNPRFISTRSSLVPRALPEETAGRELEFAEGAHSTLRSADGLGFGNGCLARAAFNTSSSWRTISENCPDDRPGP